MTKVYCKNCRWRGENDYIYKANEGGPGVVLRIEPFRWGIAGECWRFPQVYKTSNAQFCKEFKEKTK